jgi:hypothetical protein
MAESFGVVVIAIAVVAALVACASYVGTGRLYRGIGRGGLSLDEPELRPTGADPELRTEVRELVVATNERRERSGQPPLDVEAEVERRLADLGA